MIAEKKNPGFVFGGNTNWTYEQLQKQRQIAQALTAGNSGRAPRNAGEGLHAIGNALAARGINKKADARESELEGEWSAKAAGLDIPADRMAIINTMPYDQRSAYLMNYMDKQDAHRRSGAASGRAAANEAALQDAYAKITSQLMGGNAPVAPTETGGFSMGEPVVGNDGPMQMPSTAPPIGAPMQQPSQPIAQPQQLSFGEVVPERPDPRAEITGRLKDAYSMLAHPDKNMRAAAASAIKGLEGQLSLLPDQPDPEGATEYGLTPQYVTDADGNLSMIQLGKNGSINQVELPEGAAVQKGVEKLDLGTSYQWYNTITGEPIGEPIPKNNREAARETATGTAEGKAAVTSNSEVAEMERNMPGLLTVAEQLDALAEKATYTWAGQARDAANKQLGRDPGEGAIARAEYIAVVDNQVLPLLRQTFGAAFTAKEGDTLRATLGDPDKSPAEKKAVLNAFIAQKKRDLVARGGTIPEQAPASAVPDFSNMDATSIWSVDISTLDDVGMDAFEARLEELGL